MRTLLYFLFAISLIACQQQSGQNTTMGKHFTPDDAIVLEEEIDIEPPRTNEPTPPPKYDLKQGSKIIKKGVMSFDVSDLHSAKNAIDTLLKNSGGYYEQDQYNAYTNSIRYRLRLRIPSTAFDPLIQDLEAGVGKLTSKQINANDVTEEYVDTQVRLDNNLAYLAQYKDILKRAKSVKEILEVREKIRRIEEEIESKKGRLQYIDNKVTYSTLTLTLTQLINQTNKKSSFVLRIKNAFFNGVSLFSSFLIGVINLWPFLLLILIIVLFGKPLVRRLRRK